MMKGIILQIMDIRMCMKIFMLHQKLFQMNIINAVSYTHLAKGEQPPYTHKLIRLAEEGNLYKLMNDEQKDFLDRCV